MRVSILNTRMSQYKRKLTFNINKTLREAQQEFQ